MDEVTSDTFFGGRIRIRQHRNGYRFSIDAVLLAAQAGLRAGETALDLGTGCGIIPLLLGCRTPDAVIYGIEIQEELAQMALANVRDSGMEDRIHILFGDMKDLRHGMVSGPVNLVVSNPPYRKISSGRMNPHMQRAVARHEIRANLADVTETARRMLKRAGRFVTIYPAERLAELFAQMQNSGIEPKYLRAVYSGWNTGAKLIITEGVKGGRPGMKIGSPLVIYREDGSYTEEVSRMFSHDAG
ncbi:MAG: tRNA1(Val) (adenine(37)-N6)-methyltransferase [Desulfobacterales bacterium]